MGRWRRGKWEREPCLSPAPGRFRVSFYTFLTVSTERLFTTILGAWNRLPFVQISSIYWKTAAKVWNWYQRWLWRNGTRISVCNIWSGKKRTTISGVPLLPEIFRWEADPKSHVPFTFRPDFPENVCKWWWLLTIYKYFRPPRSLIPPPPRPPFSGKKVIFTKPP